MGAVPPAVGGVNAAIDGFIAGRPTYSSTRRTSQRNLMLEELDPRAELLTGGAQAAGDDGGHRPPGVGRSDREDLAMRIEHVLAVVPVADIEVSRPWYEQLLGRPADNRPMEQLVEWRVTDNGGCR